MASGPSEPPPCAGLAPAVHVSATSKEDRRSACEGAADAIGFFRAHGLQLPGRLRVLITTELPAAASASAAGCFLEKDTIYLVPYARFRSFRTWFKQPVSRAMYRSLSAHEVAHALAHCNFSVQQPSIQAKEYIAYAAMFATALLYMFDPMKFGVESFRHYSRQADGLVFLREVLAGRQMTD